MKLRLELIAGTHDRAETVANVTGDIITVNGVSYDLSATPEGDEAYPEGEHPFKGPIRRVSGQIEAAIFWFYDDRSAEPVQSSTPVEITILSGEIPDPVTRL